MTHDEGHFEDDFTTIKVFISYSWQNMLTRDKLVSKLKDAQHSPQWDQNNISVGDHLHYGILRMLEESDVVVACLTRESVDSTAVHEELTRAHHQYMKIYPIVETSIVTKLPWFLDSDSQLRYSSEQDLIKCIDRLVILLEQDKNIILNHRSHQQIRQQHFYINSLLNRMKIQSPEGPYLNQLATSVIHNLNQELNSLVHENFESIVGEGSNFLVRAKPVFENASKIYAISNDSVSSFWVSSSMLNQKLARDYLQTQPPHTIRLFVFESPDSAHNYCTILNTHAKVYGDIGRVFLCSTHSYKEIVNQFTDSDDKEKWLRSSDFAVLVYSNKKGQGSSVYKATLDGKHFKVKRSARGGFPPVEASEVIRFFTSLSDLSPGSIDPDFNVMRWQVDLHKQKDLWARKLYDLFVDREQDVIHLVFFADHAFQDINTKQQLIQKIKNVKALLDNFKEDNGNHIQCKDVWFGEFHLSHANDGITNGRIRNSDSRKYPYLLFMRFANAKSLEQWYNDHDHSNVRRSLFELFNPEIAALFNQVDEIAVANPGDVNMSTIYDEIEEKASNYMGRRDYKEAETIIDIVEKKPFRPKIKFP
jgi:hypothetical protein